MSHQKLIKQLLTPLIPLVSLNQLIKWSGQYIFAPFYHTIGTNHDLPHIAPLYTPRDPKTFEKDLDFLSLHYEFIDLPELLKLVQSNTKTTKRYCFLSFDDGLREVYEYAAPLLMQKGIPATIFINPDFVDNKALFFRYKVALLVGHLQRVSVSKTQLNTIKSLLNTKKIQSTLLGIRYGQDDLLEQIAAILTIDFTTFLKQQQPYMTTNQLKDLQTKGFHIGAHSLDHPLYQDIPVKEQIRQTTQSIQYVEHNFGMKIKSFAFPFTDFGVKKGFFEAIANANAADIIFGTAGLKTGGFDWHLQRYPMEANHGDAADLIQKEYLYYCIKRILGQHIQKYA